MTSPPSSAPTPLWLRWHGLLAVVVVAAALRLATLGRWSLWIDEAFTLHDAYDVVPSYPFGYVTTRWMVAAFGDGEFALRLLPCLFGIATVAILGLPGTDLRTTARFRLAALLLALSSWHVFWSQSARYYAALVFFVVVAARAVPRSTRGPRGERIARWTTALAACALAVACHPTAVYFAPGAILCAWPALRPRARLGLVGIGVIGIAAAVYRYGYLVPIHARYKGEGTPLQLITSYGFQAGPALLAAAALGLRRRDRRHQEDDPERAEDMRLELCFGLLPGLLFLVGSFALFTTGYHAIATLPFLMLLAARGALSSVGRTRVLLVGVLIAEQCVGLALYHTSNGMRPRHREAATAVRADPDAAVFATREAPLAYYLSPDRRVLRDAPEARLLMGTVVDELVEIAARPGVLWIVIHPDDLLHLPVETLQRFEALVAGRLALELPQNFGPKELSLRLYRLD